MDDRPAPDGGTRRRRAGTRAALGAILAACAFLVFFRIGAQSYWDDEIATVAVCGASLVHRLIAITFLDVSPPLYYVLLGPWIAVSNAEAWTRALSALCYLAGLPLVFALGVRTVGRPASLVGCLLLAVLPLGIYAAQETRPYALFFLATAALAWSVARFDNQDARGRRAAVVLSAAAVLYTHYYGLLVFAAVGAWSLARALLSPVRPLRRDARLRSLALSALLWLPWTAALFVQLRDGQDWRPRPGLGEIAGRTLIYLTTGHTPRTLPALLGGPDWAPLAGLLLALPLLALLVFAWLFRADANADAVADTGADANARRPRPWLLVVWLAGTTAMVSAVSLVKPVFNERALIGVAAPAALLAGLGAFRLARRSRVAAALVVGAACCVSLASLRLYFFDPAYEKQDWRGAAEVIALAYMPGDVVLFHSESRAIALRYYARDRFPIRHAFRWLPPEKLSPEEKWARLTETADSVAAAFDRVWLVDYHGVGFDREGVMESRLAETFVPLWTRSRYDGAYTFRVTLYERMPPPVAPEDEAASLEDEPASPEGEAVSPDEGV